MFKFIFLRMFRDYIGHIALTLFPIVLISIFAYIYKDVPEGMGSVVAFLTTGFVLMFHYFAAQYSVEFIHKDLGTPMKNRLLASPKNIALFPLIAIALSSVIAFIQSLIVLLYATFILNADFPSLIALLPIFYLSILIAQLIAGNITLISKSVAIGSGTAIGMGILFPFLAQFNAPLPDTPFLNFMRDFGTPVSLAKTSIQGVISGDMQDASIAIIVMIGLIGILSLTVLTLTRKVIR